MPEMIPGDGNSSFSEDDYVTVPVAGDMDIARYPKIRALLGEHPADGVSAILVDCSGVTFVDSVCLSELVLLGRRCEAANVRFAVYITSAQTLKVLRTTRLDQRLHVFSDRARANAFLAQTTRLEAMPDVLSESPDSADSPPQAGSNLDEPLTLYE